MVRVPAVDLPMVSSMPVGMPGRGVLTALRAFHPDVVHLAAPFVVGYRGLAAARRLGVPTVAVYQTDVPSFATAYGLGLTSRAAWRWICRLHEQADRTLAPSSWAVAALREHGVPRVYQWARGVDTRRFAPSRRDPGLRGELAQQSELLVGYVGRLAPEKQLDRLAVLSDLPGVQLVVVGDGPDAGRLRQMLPTARFLGFHDGDELARIYASLDVFVHTGPSETFCQAVQEAMAGHGVDGGVVMGRTGFRVPVRPEGVVSSHPAAVAADAALKDAVLTLRDDGLRVRFGAVARTSVLRRTWSRIGDELLAHYAEVLDRGAPAAAA